MNVIDHLTQGRLRTTRLTYPHVWKYSAILVYTELGGSVDGDPGDSVVVDEVIEAQTGFAGVGIIH